MRRKMSIRSLFLFVEKPLVPDHVVNCSESRGGVVPAAGSQEDHASEQQDTSFQGYGLSRFIGRLLRLEDKYGAVVYLRQVEVYAGVHEQFSAEVFAVEPEAGFVDVQLRGVPGLGIDRRGGISGSANGPDNCRL